MWGVGKTSASSRTEGVIWHTVAAVPSFAHLQFTRVLLWACFITIKTLNHTLVCSDTAHCGYRHIQCSGQSHEHGFILSLEPTHTTADSIVKYMIIKYIQLDNMKCHLDGCLVRGPSFPSKCRMRTARLVCSQSSINSQRCARPERIQH